MKNSGFKMKGHTLPGPNQKSSPARVVGAVAAAAAKEAAKKALIETAKKTAMEAAVQGAVQIGVNKISASGENKDNKGMDQSGFAGIKFGA